MAENKRVGDHFGEDNLGFEVKNVSAVLDKDFLLESIIPRTSSFGEYNIMICKDLKSDKPIGIRSFSDVIAQKLDYLEKNYLLPILVKVVKKNKYHDIV